MFHIIGFFWSFISRVAGRIERLVEAGVSPDAATDSWVTFRDVVLPTLTIFSFGLINRLYSALGDAGDEWLDGLLALYGLL